MCMQRVEDILDLKFCTDGVQTALQEEEYETVSTGLATSFFWNISPDNLLFVLCMVSMNSGWVISCSYRYWYQMRNMMLPHLIYKLPGLLAEG